MLSSDDIVEDANHITTRISFQTAGLAFGSTGLCSYRVRGVDGSCAKHLTAESYMVIYAGNSHAHSLLVFHHPLFHSRTFFSANPFHCSLFFFFFRTDHMIAQTFTVTSEHIRFYFFCFTLFSCFRAVD